MLGPGLVRIHAEVVDFMLSVRKRDGVEEEEWLRGMVSHPFENVRLNKILGVSLPDA